MLRCQTLVWLIENLFDALDNRKPKKQVSKDDLCMKNGEWIGELVAMTIYEVHKIHHF